ncbi:hypothetical protein TNIN_384131 [Trichonephila inaurata madagascariensis]|uniref:Uncharacterized protein n=1 Tax=Trichonephila inaurata madagascariensis TaxID=2747483 RepID=A0A8X7C517_9ARAC|nr:hypothetical protein TNIN_384131 [Trichonephila inaurata madagascariensis]
MTNLHQDKDLIHADHPIYLEDTAFNPVFPIIEHTILCVNIKRFRRHVIAEQLKDKCEAMCLGSLQHSVAFQEEDNMLLHPIVRMDET